MVGFFANMAAKSEMKLRDQVLTCFDEFSDEFEMKISTGNVLLPCHIISEAHNGFFVEYEDELVGVFRCQNHWWLHELDAETVQGLRSPESQKWMNKLSKQRPADGGELQGGIPAFVGSMLMMLKQIADAEKEKIAAEKARKKQAKKAEKENRQLRIQQVTNLAANAAALLWDSGCEMKVAHFVDPDHDYVAEGDAAFSLYFIRVRRDSTLTLYADMANNLWLLADSAIPEAGSVSRPIDNSTKTTAITFLQLLVEHGFKHSDLNSAQKSWANYIDTQFLPRMTDGIILELLTMSSDAVKKDTQRALDAMIAAYNYYPDSQYSLPELTKLRKL